MKKQTKVVAILALLITSCIFLYSADESKTLNSSSKKELPSFFERVPTNVKKVRQHINIDIDYEKLPARNEIRLVAKLKTNHLKSNLIEYKWTLKDNLIFKRGSIKGEVNAEDAKELTLDVAIKDMNKRINVRLEAYAKNTKVRLGAVQSFTYDPTSEDILEVERLEAQSKAQSKTLSKKEQLEKVMFAPRKPSFQQ